MHRTRSPPEISFDDYLAESRANPHAAFANLTTRLDRVLAGRKLVLLFDEYELFENCIDKNTISIEVFNLLANWMEHKEGVFIVFTGSDKLEARSPVLLGEVPREGHPPADQFLERVRHAAADTGAGRGHSDVRRGRPG